MPDPNAVAFLPWVYTEEPLSLGQLRLLPYQKEQLPGNLPNVTQIDIDGILSVYSNRPNHPVTRATLLEYENWRAGMPITDRVANELFRIRNVIAFSALSHRSLFRGHTNYCNSHTYSLVLQRFKPGETGTFAFQTRRRDGGTSHMWGSDDFAFHRPNHVDHWGKLALDEPLLLALLPIEEGHRAYEAIVEFNAANTDSSDVPSHVEAVMCKSAFEWLLNIDSRWEAFIDALEDRLGSVDPNPCDGPLKETWMRRWPRQSRPLLAWARDFCAVRGTSAHGMARTPFVWANHQHLAFISIFFPLLLKKVLADDGVLEIDPIDLEHLRRIEQYLMHDPFAHDWDADQAHPWSDIRLHARMAVRARNFYPSMD